MARLRARPGRVFVHLAVQEPTPPGEEPSWFEHVAEDQYRETPELFLQGGRQMIIKQYIITLPADFDMAIIRERVRKKGPAFDTFPGLGLKAFMIREKGRFGAENNQYAPVYLWPSVEAIWGFIAGEGFDGILQSFGWTPVYNWLGLVFAQTDQADALHQLQSVTREEQRIVAGTDLAALCNREIADARRTIDSTPGLLMRAAGINPETWSLVRFDYWSRRQDALPEGVHNYEVLHISAPNLETLKGYGSGSSDRA